MSRWKHEMIERLQDHAESQLDDSEAAETRADVSRIKWAGWIMLAGIACWMASQLFANSTDIARIEERQKTQFEQLREDIAEVKSMLMDLLKRGAVP